MISQQKTMTLEEWQAEGTRRFGPQQRKWKFVCPSCGHVADSYDWEAAGAPESAVAFSCLGRWKGGDPEKTFQRSGGPCDYAGGGLFRLNPVKVLFDEGKEIFVFEFADEERVKND